MVVVAGPPGSGKTTFFPASALGIDAFSIDDRCAQLVGSYRSIPHAVRAAVARECEPFVHRHIDDRRSFAVETTMRTRAAIRQAETARQVGFATTLNFIATEAPEINVERVLQRAQAGGHAASESEVRATYAASLANLAGAIGVFESCRVYDATESWRAPRLVVMTRAGIVEAQRNAPTWALEALAIRPL